MHLGRIVIFPIKSLDGMVVEEAAITAGGILENDRVFAILDKAGAYVNGKRTPRIHQLRCSFDAQVSEVRLWQTGESSQTQFRLDETDRISGWLGEFFGYPVTLQRESQKGFPDDRTAFGPTVVGEASLRAIQEWYPGLELESLRRRFRTNLELTGGVPFEEDRLFGAPEELKPFQIGPVQFLGHNPCQRCVVPSRDPDSGEAVPEFQKKFAQLRGQHLPAWANAQRFNHFYRFAVNTSILPAEAGKCLRVGDVLSL
ncbi:MAG TPA: MOSC N-terminal beta barrel domain-containing protein [Verrucomicrobiae bacterium]|nr:MOSC N-terminal beta barrel domain-containing protein [Verrucomicrobiae bacterium]